MTGTYINIKYAETIFVLIGDLGVKLFIIVYYYTLLYSTTNYIFDFERDFLMLNNSLSNPSYFLELENTRLRMTAVKMELIFVES